jgi:hypothetical protein
MTIFLKRLETANQVINLLMPSTRLLVQSDHICVEWKTSKGIVCKQWQTHKGSFFPTWSEKFPTGGTVTTAIAQLINWVRDKPCLPIQTWRYWCGDSVRMRPLVILDILDRAGYPSEFRCVFCGKKDGQMDWYTFNKQSGLGCYSPCDAIREAMNRA